MFTSFQPVRTQKTVCAFKQGGNAAKLDYETELTVRKHLNEHLRQYQINLPVGSGRYNPWALTPPDVSITKKQQLIGVVGNIVYLDKTYAIGDRFATSHGDCHFYSVRTYYESPNLPRCCWQIGGQDGCRVFKYMTDKAHTLRRNSYVRFYNADEERKERGEEKVWKPPKCLPRDIRIQSDAWQLEQYHIALARRAEFPSGKFANEIYNPAEPVPQAPHAQKLNPDGTLYGGTYISDADDDDDSEEECAVVSSNVQRTQVQQLAASLQGPPAATSTPNRPSIAYDLCPDEVNTIGTKAEPMDTCAGYQPGYCQNPQHQGYAQQQQQQQQQQAYAPQPQQQYQEYGQHQGLDIKPQVGNYQSTSHDNTYNEPPSNYRSASFLRWQSPTRSNTTIDTSRQSVSEDTAAAGSEGAGYPAQALGDGSQRPVYYPARRIAHEESPKYEDLQCLDQRRSLPLLHFPMREITLKINKRLAEACEKMINRDDNRWPADSDELVFDKEVAAGQFAGSFPTAPGGLSQEGYRRCNLGNQLAMNAAVPIGELTRLEEYAHTMINNIVATRVTAQLLQGEFKHSGGAKVSTVGMLTESLIASLNAGLDLAVEFLAYSLYRRRQAQIELRSDASKLSANAKIRDCCKPWDSDDLFSRP